MVRTHKRTRRTKKDKCKRATKTKNKSNDKNRDRTGTRTGSDRNMNNGKYKDTKKEMHQIIKKKHKDYIMSRTRIKKGKYNHKDQNTF